MTTGKPAPLTGEVQDTAHVLVLGGRSFPCAAHLPIGTLMRNAGQEISGLETYHKLLSKLVRVDDLDELWDACDDLAMDKGPQAVIDAIGETIASYSGRPTEAPVPSQDGSSVPAEPESSAS